MNAEDAGPRAAAPPVAPCRIDGVDALFEQIKLGASLLDAKRAAAVEFCEADVGVDSIEELIHYGFEAQFVAKLALPVVKQSKLEAALAAHPAARAKKLQEPAPADAAAPGQGSSSARRALEEAQKDDVAINTASLELTPETAARAYLRLGLRDAGGVWACATSEQLRAWLEVMCEDARGVLRDKAPILHELLVDGGASAEPAAASLLTFDSGTKRLPFGSRTLFLKQMRAKQGLSLYQLAARGVLQEPAHVLASFAFEGELGRGSYGLTWKVRGKLDGRSHCIKVLALSEAARKEYGVRSLSNPEQARAEFEKMRRVHHENVVHAAEFGEAAPHAFWAQLEFCAGGDLKVRLAAANVTGIDEPTAWKWTCECAAGLEAIHAAGVMHRDIKPENVLLTAADDAAAICKLGDLGLGVDIEGTAVSFRGGKAGTLIYMAPEVLAGDKYSARADVFSLGMVYFEVSSGGAHKFQNHDGERDAELFAQLPEGRGKILTLHALERKKDRASSKQLLELSRTLASEPAARFTRGDFFAYVAIATPPFLLNQGVEFTKQLKRIEERLRSEQVAWIESNKCPVCLSDADSSVAGADARASHAHAFVWCAAGRGWESRAGTNAIDFDGLVAALKDVQLLIVCLRHGARRAAEHARDAPGVRTVAWISADVHDGDGVDVFFRVIVPLLDIAKSRSPTSEDMRRLAKEEFALLRCGVLESSAACAPWPPVRASSDGWLRVKAEEADFARELSLRVLSRDIGHAAHLKITLRDQAAGAGLACVHILSTSPAEAQDTRCRALALDVCRAFARAGAHGAFEFVGRLSNQAEVDAFETRLVANRPSPALLWVDLLDGGLIARDDEYALEWLVTTLASFGARAATTLLITGDERSRRDAQLVVEELGFDGANEYDIGRQAGPEGVEAVSKHAEAIKIRTPDFVGFEVLRDALEKHLPARAPIAAMYLEDDGDVIVRLCVSDVAFLHQLASVVLTGAPRRRFARRPWTALSFNTARARVFSLPFTKN